MAHLITFGDGGGLILRRPPVTGSHWVTDSVGHHTDLDMSRQGQRVTAPVFWAEGRFDNGLVLRTAIAERRACVLDLDEELGKT